MAACETGQQPWYASDPQWSAATPQEACAAWATYWNLTNPGFDDTTRECIGQDNGQTVTVSTVQACEAVAQPVQCTASSPCIVHLTPEQTQQFESWTFVFVIVAMVFAALHGLSFGSTRV